jgi:arylsulfatase A-like enzyme
VQRLGRTNELFSDHTDVRPTLLSLAGLKDDYTHDGRVLFEILDRDAVPHALRERGHTLSRLAAAYKAINAPRGELGRKSLKIATEALTSNATTIDALDDRLNDLTAHRNALAAKMIALLEGAAFDNQPIDQNQAEHLIDQAEDLLASVQ